VLILACAGPARAQVTVLDAAAQALRSTSVYVDGGAERAKDIDAGRLQAKIAQGDEPIFVAILPASAAGEAGGNPGAVPAALGRMVGLRGTYAVLIGSSFRAASNALPTGRAETLATSAFQRRSGDNPQPVLEDFVGRVNRAQAGSSGSSTGSGSGSSTGSGVILLLLAVAGGGLFFWSRRRRRRAQAEERKELAADRQLLQAELSVLGDDVLALEPDVTVHPDARADRWTSSGCGGWSKKAGTRWPERRPSCRDVSHPLHRPNSPNQAGATSPPSASTIPAHRSTSDRARRRFTAAGDGSAVAADC